MENVRGKTEKTSLLSFLHVPGGNPIKVIDTIFRAFLRGTPSDIHKHLGITGIRSYIFHLTFYVFRFMIFTIHIASFQSLITGCHHSYLSDSTGFAIADLIA